MSTKFKHTQKKHRWAGTGIEVPEPFLQQLAAATRQAPQSSPASAFLALLRCLCEAHDTEQEVALLPQLCSALKHAQQQQQQQQQQQRQPTVRGAAEPHAAVSTEAGGGPGGQAKAEAEASLACVQLAVRLLFLGRSKPLHKQLLAALRPSLADAGSQRALRQVLAENMHLGTAAAPESNSDDAAAPGMPAAAAWASLLAFAPAHELLEGCASSALASLAAQLHDMLSSTSAGCHLSPMLATDLQDALSAMYTLMARYGRSSICGATGGSQALLAAARCAIAALRGVHLLRDAASSAAIMLWAAVALPDVSDAEAARMLAQGFCSVDGATPVAAGGYSQRSGSFVESQWLQEGTSVARELAQCSPYACMCAIRALSALLPAGVLCRPLTPPQQTGGEAAAACDGGVLRGPQQTCSEAPRDTAQPHTWTLLLDGFANRSMAAVRATSDSHEKLVAMTALLASLQQYASLLGSPPPAAAGPEPSAASPIADGVRKNGGEPEDTDRDGDDASAGGAAVPPMPHDLARGVFELVLACQGDSLKLVPAAAAQVFAALCAIAAKTQETPGHAPALEGFAAALFSLPSSLRGRYALLHALAACMSARRLLAQHPALIAECLRAMRDDAASAASDLLRALLTSLHVELTGASDNGAGGAAALQQWRQEWVPQLAAALLDSDSAARGRVAAYALPVVLQLDPPCMRVLLAHFFTPRDTSSHAAPPDGPARRGDERAGANDAAAAVLVLRAAKSAAVFDSLDEVSSGAPAAHSHAQRALPPGLLMAAATHRDEALRLDVLELAALSHKSASVPGQAELGLVLHQLPVTLRSTSSGSSNRWLAIMTKLAMRIRQAALGAQMRLAREPAPPNGAAAPAESDITDAAGLARMQAFMQALTSKLCASLCAGAAPGRKRLALCLLHNLLLVYAGDAWLAVPLAPGSWADRGAVGLDLPQRSSRGKGALQRDLRQQQEGAAATRHARFDPLFQLLRTAPFAEVLLACLGDSWDVLRHAARSVLQAVGHPIAGYSSVVAVQALLRRGLRGLRQLRAPAADAGAAIVSLVHTVYVRGLHWRVVDGALREPDAGIVGAVDLQSLQLLGLLLDASEEAVRHAQRDMAPQCREGFLQGRLLAIRYIVGDIPWRAVLRDAAAAQRASALLARLLDVALAAARLCMPYLDGTVNVGAADVFALEDDREECADGDSAPAATTLVTGCWCTVKEASLLLANVAQLVPLSPPPPLPAPLAPGHMERAGRFFVDALATVKHNGATEKLHLGFGFLCRALLLQQGPALNALPGEWLQVLLRAVTQREQTRSDIVRRSAGLPLAFVAIFQAEAPGAPKRLLPFAAKALLAIAGGGGDALRDVAGSADDARAADQPPAGPLDGDDDSAEDVGVWARVHAFNCLRVTFDSSALAADTSSHFAAGAQLCVVAMTSDHWEIRNAATLCYVAIIARIVGFKNAPLFECSRASVTLPSLLSRYPNLHPFLLVRLAAAVSQLDAHPAAAPPATLHPLLILLTRLKPPSAAADAALPLAPFKPLLAAACAARPFAVRELAARALCTCVAPQELPEVLTQHLAALPDTPGAVAVANAAHGTLCVVRALLSVNVGVCGAAEATTALRASAPRLVECAWLADAAHTGCPAVSRAYVQALAAAARAAERIGDAVSARPLGSEGLRAKLSGIVAAAAHTHSHAPMWALWLKELARYLLPRGVVREVLAGSAGVPVDLSQAQDAAAQGCPQLCNDVLQLLRCPVMEVRAEVLRCLVKRNAAPSGGGARDAECAATHSAEQSGGRELLEAVTSLSRHSASDKVRRRALQLLAALPPQHAGVRHTSQSDGALGAEAVSLQLSGVHLAAAKQRPGGCSERQRPAEEASGSSSRVTELQSLLRSGRLVRAQPHALVCLGSELGAMWASAACDRAALLSSLHAFADTLARWSDAEEGEDRRSAAAAALHRSGLLNPIATAVAGRHEQEINGSAPSLIADANQSRAEVCLRCWSVALALLEDEDPHIRTAMAAGAGAALDASCAGSGPTSRGSSGTVGPSEQAAAEAQGTRDLSTACAAQVMDATFDTLRAAFGHRPAFIAWLLQWLTPGSSVIAPGAQHTRRLFDREPPNRQAEPLVLAQLAARTLRALGAELQSARDGADSAREAGMPAGGDECQAAAALAAGFTDAVEGLAAVVRAAQALQGDVEGDGSICSARDVHLALHTRLLALHALLPATPHPAVAIVAEAGGGAVAEAAEALLAIEPADPFILRALACTLGVVGQCLAGRGLQGGTQAAPSQHDAHALRVASLHRLRQAQESALKQLCCCKYDAEAALWSLL